MPIELGVYPTIQPDTALGQALVAFFDVLEPIFADGENGVFQVIVFGGCAVHVHTQARGVLMLMQKWHHTGMPIKKR